MTNRATTVTNVVYTDADSGSFDQAPGTAPLLAGIATIIPQIAMYNPVLQSQIGVEVLLATPAGQTCSFEVVSNPSGRTIVSGDLVMMDVVSVVAPVSSADFYAATWTVVATPNASSGVTRGLFISLTSNPTANYPGEVDALFAFVYHTAGNFTQAILRAVAGTVVNQAPGTVAETRALQGTIYAIGAGTINTLSIGVDSTWVSETGGEHTTWVAFRNRQSLGSGGVVPTTEYGIIVYGYNQFAKGITIGAFSSATNTSLWITQSLSPSAGVAMGINVANTFVASANSDVFYGISMALTITKGAYTGLSLYGISLLLPGASGAGTIAQAAQMYLELPTIATGNYYAVFGSTLDTTALGTYQGRLPVKTTVAAGWIPVYNS